MTSQWQAVPRGTGGDLEHCVICRGGSWDCPACGGTGVMSRDAFEDMKASEDESYRMATTRYDVPADES